MKVSEHMSPVKDRRKGTARGYDTYRARRREGAKQAYRMVKRVLAQKRHEEKHKPSYAYGGTDG